MRNEFEEDIDESFARLFFFFPSLARVGTEREEKRREREEEGGGRTKRRKDRDGNKGMSGRESGGSRPESTQP